MTYQKIEVQAFCIQLVIAHNESMWNTLQHRQLTRNWSCAWALGGAICTDRHTPVALPLLSEVWQNLVLLKIRQDIRFIMHETASKMHE